MKKLTVLLLVILPILLLFVACNPTNVVEHKLIVGIKGYGRVEPGTGLFKSGTVVAFKVEPDAGWAFSHWEGEHAVEVTKGLAEDSDGEDWRILVNGDKRIEAVFVDLAKYWNLDIQIEGEGNVQPSPGRFKDGTTVTLSVQPQTGWQFSGWEGKNKWDLIKDGQKWDLIMDENKRLVAIFEKDAEYGLDVTVIGEGRVDQKILNSTMVRLTAVPNNGWKFTKWSGDASGTNPVYDISFTGNKHVIAEFERVNFALDISVVGRGRVDEQLIRDVEINDYPYGSSVKLTAVPDRDWIFKEWSGDAISKEATIYVEIDKNKRITAVFEEQKNEYRIDIKVVGKGRVEEKLLSDASIFTDYPYQSRVRLWAHPDEGWVFKEWTGDVRGTEPVVTLDMDKDKSVTAIFEQRQHTLAINVIGDGSVEQKLVGNSSDGDYPDGSIIRLRAVPKRNWDFKEWRGDITGTDILTHIEMDGNKKVTAVFVKKTFNLDIIIEGSGRVEENLIDSTDYPYDSLIELKAIASNGWLFKEWRGDASGKNAKIEIYMDEDKEVIAVFVKAEDERYRLTVDITGNGRVSKNPDSSDYAPGTTVTLTATADSGWEFREWRGDISDSSNVVQIKMDKAKFVEAVFEKKAATDSNISGQISLNHSWPSPYATKESSLSKIRSGLDKIASSVKLNNNINLNFREEYVPGQLIIGFRESAGEEEISQILTIAGVQYVDDIPELNTYLVKTQDCEIMSAMSILNSSQEVAYVERNYRAYGFANTRIPNDTFYNYQWHFDQIRLPQAWTVTTGSSSVRVAILDTGIDTDHPDIGNIVDVASGYNFVNNNTNTKDGKGHGTHVAGTIGADTNNNRGIAGIMWQGSIIPIKVLDDKGQGDFYGVAKGILYAAGLDNERPLARPAHVINLSLGGAQGNTVLEDAVKQAYRAGVIIVASAGMTSDNVIGYPAAYQEVIAVGAVDYNYPNCPQRCDYSSYGMELDLMAPGGDNKQDSNQDGYADGVISTSFDENKTYSYYMFSGTSMASAHTSGVVGLMLSNGVPASEVRSVLHRTAFDLGTPGFDQYHGHGLINAYWAVNNVKEIKILVGTKNGNTINAVAQGTVDLKSNSYSLPSIPPGEYQVFGWIDVQKNGIIDSGDYLYESAKMTFEGGNHTINLSLEEK